MLRMSYSNLFLSVVRSVVRLSVLASVRWHTQTTSVLKPLRQFCSNLRSLLRLEEQKIVKIVAVHWPRRPPCPYMVKTFKNLLLQDRGYLWAESLHKSSETGVLPKLLQWWSYIDVWPLYSEVKFAFLWICMDPIHSYGKKNVDSFKWLLLLCLWANVTQISYGVSLWQGNERLLKWSWFVDQNDCHADKC